MLASISSVSLRQTISRARSLEYSPRVEIPLSFVRRCECSNWLFAPRLGARALTVLCVPWRTRSLKTHYRSIYRATRFYRSTSQCARMFVKKSWLYHRVVIFPRRLVRWPGFANYELSGYVPSLREVRTSSERLFSKEGNSGRAMGIFICSRKEFL